MKTVGNPHLRAIDDIFIALTPGHGSNRLQIRAAIGLGQADPATQFARREARKVCLLLRFGSIALHGHRHDDVRVDDACDRHPHDGNALDDLRVRHGRKPEPAVLRRDQATEESHGLHFLDDFRRINIVVLEFPDMGLDFLLEKSVHHVQDQLFLPAVVCAHFFNLHQSVIGMPVPGIRPAMRQTPAQDSECGFQSRRHARGSLAVPRCRDTWR